ncbi:MAG: BACON domain-containing protein, partial [Planctomycetaceae bacterium]|nr:BACON domain-containing protein [Planctomycetaceae bacterium]
SYSLEPNTTLESRTTTITITAGNITRTHILTQEFIGAQLNTTLVANGTNVSYFIPRDGSLDGTWHNPGFDGSSWKNVPQPVGFESPGGQLHAAIITDISADMKGVNATGYFRFPFHVDTSMNRLLSATLDVMIDDGYVAYLNGVEVARFNAPMPINWDSRATGLRSDRIVLSEKFTTDISGYLDAIVDGENVLAIQAMNTSSGSSDFLLGVELSAVNLTNDPGKLKPVFEDQIFTVDSNQSVGMEVGK